jgi:hypothetical protein
MGDLERVGALLIAMYSISWAGEAAVHVAFHMLDAFLGHDKLVAIWMHPSDPLPFVPHTLHFCSLPLKPPLWDLLLWSKFTALGSMGQRSLCGDALPLHYGTHPCTPNCARAI